MNKINIAIVGLGNCASSLIQGIGYYSKDTLLEKEKVGLIHNNICGYKISDINVVAAFEANKGKIDIPISEAIFKEPNCTKIFYDDKKLFKNKVSSGPVLDGISARIGKLVQTHKINKSNKEWQRNIVNELRAKNVDIMVSYLPVGSVEASKFYANCALEAKVGFVNAIPEFICSSSEWSKKFEKAGVPCAGDDIKSQFGATLLHRILVDFINKRGQIIDNTYQLNVGGNTDFMNMLDEERLISKRISKTEAVTKLIEDYDLVTKIGPSDYIPHLKDNKVCYIEINGRQFGNVPFKVDVKLSVEDSPNSAGVIADAIRLTKVAKDRKLSGYQEFSSYYFKHPMKQYRDDEAIKIVEEFIENI